MCLTKLGLAEVLYKFTYFDYLRTSFKANVKLVVRKRNV